MDAMECPHCKETVVPKVTRGQTGMHSRICPLCGKNVESLLNQDASQITVNMPPKVGLAIFGVIVALIILIIVSAFLM